MRPFAGAVSIVSLFWAGCSPAAAVPDCWGVLALNAANEKVVRITCSDDRAPGTAATYRCSYRWKVRSTNGRDETLAGSFACARGETNLLKVEHSRLSDGSKIADEVDGVSMSCVAQ